MRELSVRRPFASPVPRRAVGIEIHDGLGNQLFEFATAYALSRRIYAELLLDTRIIRTGSGRRFALGAMGLRWRECIAPQSRGLLRTLAYRLGIGSSKTLDVPLFTESGPNFMPSVLAISTPVFLRGYFQFWRYFEGYEDEIREQFDLSKLATERTAPFEAAMAASHDTVAVHVRRGDYHKVLAPLLGRSYYDSALARLSTEKARPRPFVFSDDPIAARDLLKHWPDAVFVTGTSEFEDFYLMTRCSHAIIANSTFSWWAAWMRKAPHAGRVVAPRTWLRDVDESKDRYPVDWLLVP